MIAQRHCVVSVPVLKTVLVSQAVVAHAFNLISHDKMRRPNRNGSSRAGALAQPAGLFQPELMCLLLELKDSSMSYNFLHNCSTSKDLGCKVGKGYVKLSFFLEFMCMCFCVGCVCVCVCV